MAVWDTSVASGLRPNTPLYELVSEAAHAGEPIRIAAATAHEIAFGLGLRAEADRRFAALLRSFRDLLESEVIEVLPLNWDSALLAGRIRAALPTPPTGSRASRSRGPKPERRVAWIADIQIAATAWLAGEEVCTADKYHFEALRDVIALQFPEEGQLQVLPPPRIDP